MNKLENILKIAEENDFIGDIINDLESGNTMECDSGEWLYLRQNDKYGGRDFYDYIPIQYMTPEEVEKLEDYYLEDFYIEDYEWGEYDVNDVIDMLTDELMYYIIEKLQRR